MVDLLYIDEEPEQANKLVRAAAQSGFFDQNSVKAMQPLPTVSETIEAINEIGCRVLVTDFRLNEFAPEVTYFGTELVAAYQAIHDGFPCFVTTSFANDAIDSTHDANTVFSKAEAFATPKEEQPLPFFKRVRKKITEYEDMLEALSNRHSALLKKLEKDTLTPVERDELLRLDDQIEKALNSEHKMALDLRERALEPMSDLIRKTQKFLEDLEKGIEDGSE